MFLTKTFAIQDTWKYDPTTYSADHYYNLQLQSSKYSLEFDIMKKANNGTGGLELGTSTSSDFLVGCGSSNNMYLSRWGTGVTFTTLVTLTANVWKTVLLEVDGSTIDIKVDGSTYTVTGVSADTSYLLRVNCNNTNLNFRNLKIKPL